MKEKEMARFEHKSIVWHQPYSLRNDRHLERGLGCINRDTQGYISITKMDIWANHESDFVLIDIGGIGQAKALRDALNEFIAEEESAEEN